MIRSVRELLDEVENQIGDHDESEVPVVVAFERSAGVWDGGALMGIEYFNGTLVLNVHRT